MATPLSDDEFAAHPGTADWHVVEGAAHTEFRCSSFAAAAHLIAAIGDAADAANHHPDVDLRFPGRVVISMRTHDVDSLSDLDVALAAAISELAADAGATAHPEAAPTDN